MADESIRENELTDDELGQAHGGVTIRNVITTNYCESYTNVTAYSSEYDELRRQLSRQFGSDAVSQLDALGIDPAERGVSLRWKNGSLTLNGYL